MVLRDTPLHRHNSKDATFSPFCSLLMTLNTQPQSSSTLKTVRIAVNEPTVSIVQLPRSQPIPIVKKKNRNDEEDAVVDTSYYDLMTWNMYARIVTARRLRASYQARDYMYTMDEAYDQEQLITCRDVKSMTNAHSQWRKTAARYSSSTEP